MARSTLIHRCRAAAHSTTSERTSLTACCGRPGQPCGRCRPRWSLTTQRGHGRSSDARTGRERDGQPVTASVSVSGDGELTESYVIWSTEGRIMYDGKYVRVTEQGATTYETGIVDGTDFASLTDRKPRTSSTQSAERPTRRHWRGGARDHCTDRSRLPRRRRGAPGRRAGDDRRSAPRLSPAE